MQDALDRFMFSKTLPPRYQDPAPPPRAERAAPAAPQLPPQARQQQQKKHSSPPHASKQRGFLADMPPTAAQQRREAARDAPPPRRLGRPGILKGAEDERPLDGVNYDDEADEEPLAGVLCQVLQWLVC